jgi:hypothetical protein
LYLPDDEFSIHSYDHGGQLAGRDMLEDKVHPVRAIPALQIVPPSLPGRDFCVSAVPSTFSTHTRIFRSLRCLPKLAGLVIDSVL